MRRSPLEGFVEAEHGMRNHSLQEVLESGAPILHKRRILLVRLEGMLRRQRLDTHTKKQKKTRNTGGNK